MIKVCIDPGCEEVAHNCSKEETRCRSCAGILVAITEQQYWKKFSANFFQYDYLTGNFYKPNKMTIDTNKLLTLHHWAKQWTRETTENGQPVQKVGCAVSFAHELFNPDNKKPVALRVREEFQLVVVDGVKFVARVEDIPKKKGGKHA